MKREFTLKDNYLLKITCIILMISFTSIYYWAIHHTFMPNGEDLLALGLPKDNSVFDTISGLWSGMIQYTLKIGYKLYGYSLETIRFSKTVPIIIMYILSLVIIFEKKDNYFYLKAVIATLFLSLLPIIQDNSNFGKVIENDDQVISYPFDYHQPAHILALMCFIFLILISTKKINNMIKIGLIIFFLLVSIWVCKSGTDILFIIEFIMPCVIVGFLRMMKNTGKRYTKIFIISILVLLGITIITKYLSVFNILWESSEAGVYDSFLYGNPNWTNMNNIFENIGRYFFMMNCLCDVDVSSTRLISMWSFLKILKGIFLIFGYLIILMIVKNSMRPTENNEKISWIDEIIVWGFILLSLAAIFTDKGDNIHEYRYFGMLVFYFGIILCRNVDMLLDFSKLQTFIDRYQVTIVLLLLELCIGLCYPIIGKAEKKDTLYDEYQKIIEYLEAQDEKGPVYAPMFARGRITAQSGGEINCSWSDDNLTDEDRIVYVITSMEKDKHFSYYSYWNNRTSPMGNNYDKDNVDVLETVKFEHFTILKEYVSTNKSWEESYLQIAKLLKQDDLGDGVAPNELVINIEPYLDSNINIFSCTAEDENGFSMKAVNNISDYNVQFVLIPKHGEGKKDMVSKERFIELFGEPAEIYETEEIVFIKYNDERLMISLTEN